MLLIGLVVGAVVTSYAEYKLGYNLYDLLKDKLFGKSEDAAQ